MCGYWIMMQNVFLNVGCGFKELFVNQYYLLELGQTTASLPMPFSFFKVAEK